MKINPLLSGTLLFFPLLLMSRVPRSNEDSLSIDNVLVPIIVQTLSIGTRGPALCINEELRSGGAGSNAKHFFLHPRIAIALLIAENKSFLANYEKIDRQETELCKK